MTKCVFCDKIDDGSAESIGQVGVYHFEPLNPVTPGHRLFIPREHVEKTTINSAIMGLVFNIAMSWAHNQEPDFNLIINVGSDASQTIPHLHVHYVPRTPEDGLILPWSNQIKH